MQSFLLQSSADRTAPRRQLVALPSSAALLPLPWSGGLMYVSAAGPVDSDLAVFSPAVADRFHVPRPGCDCEKCADGRVAAVRRALLEGAELNAGDVARGKLLRRRDLVDLGLSNPAYLAAPAGTARNAGRTSENSDKHWSVISAELAALASPVELVRPSPSNLPARVGDKMSAAFVAGSRREPVQPSYVARMPSRYAPLAVPVVSASQVRVSLSPARSSFRFSDALGDHLSPLVGASGSKRGNIKELSEASRGRLADTAYTLTEQGYTPAVMLTLTSPGNWKDVYLGQDEAAGKLFKRHLAAFRKRLSRKLENYAIQEYKALWFLEFQLRGAPHAHLMLFDVTISPKVRKALRDWCGRAWAGVVGNPIKAEKIKHTRAGTQVSKMRRSHFGYAVKYATKTEQKTVPEDFNKVGRFWGVWDYKSPKPVVLVFDFTHLNTSETAFVRSVVGAAIDTIEQFSPVFSAMLRRRLERVLDQGVKNTLGFAVFGAASRVAAESAIIAA